MSRKFVWIEAEQSIRYAVGFEIGVDISQEDADKLISLDMAGDDIKEGSELWDEISQYLTADCVCDWGDLEMVEIYEENE